MQMSIYNSSRPPFVRGRQPWPRQGLDWVAKLDFLSRIRIVVYINIIYLSSWIASFSVLPKCLNFFKVFYLLKSAVYLCRLPMMTLRWVLLLRYAMLCYMEAAISGSISSKIIIQFKRSIIKHLYSMLFLCLCYLDIGVFYLCLIRNHARSASYIHNMWRKKKLLMRLQRIWNAVQNFKSKMMKLQPEGKGMNLTLKKLPMNQNGCSERERIVH